VSQLSLSLYRTGTRLKALRSLYSLRPEEVDAFMNAYQLFDGDWTNENGKREEQIIDYYNVLNHLCSLGTVEKMYFPPYTDPNTGVTGNQVAFEQKMMEDLGVGPGMRVLDIGCGRGRVAHHVASHSGADVTGINLDPSQLASATEYAGLTGYQSKCHFQQASLNDRLPFADETFDAAYEIQAFSYCKDKVAVFSEVLRVLKPGARFSYLDWVLLPAFDASNPEHTDLVRRAAPLLGSVDNPPLQDVIQSMEKAGFEIELSENPSLEGQQHQLISAEDRYFHWLRNAIGAAAKLRVVPTYFPMLMDRLMKNADALITVDRLGIGTTAYHIVCRRPEA